MKKFEFRLESVLKVRQRAVTQAQEAVLAADLVLRERKHRAEILHQEKADVEADLKLLQQSGGSAEEHALYLEYLQQMRLGIANQEDLVLQAGSVLAEKQHALAEARKEEKAIENLREREYSRWKKQIEQHEAKALDEMATMQYLRDQRGESE